MTRAQDEILYMDIKEFRERGFLQEVNRQFLHPLGLALEVTGLPNGEEIISGVWDYRDDPEGMNFADGVIDADKALEVKEEMQRHEVERFHALGYIEQPVPGVT